MISRLIASQVDSPCLTEPPGRLHLCQQGSFSLRMSNTEVPLKIAPETALLIMGNKNISMSQLYTIIATINSTMSKTFTVDRKGLVSRMVTEVQLLLQNSIQFSSLTISCQDIQADIKEQSKYDIDLLQEQILLFDNDAEIYSFIQTEKELSANLSHLMELPFALIKLAQRYLQRSQSLDSYLHLPDNLASFNSKEKLDELETKCLESLSEIKERRKKLDCCVICWEKYATHVILPCMHLAICRECVGVKKCPLCKVGVSQINCVFR